MIDWGRLSWCPLLVTLLYLPPVTQYQYTEEAYDDFKLEQQVQVLRGQVESLAKEVKRLQAAQSDLSKRFKAIERGERSYSSRRTQILEEEETSSISRKTKKKRKWVISY